MKASLLFSYCLFFIIFNCYGQAGKTLSGDTTFWYKMRYQDGEKVGIKNLVSTTDRLHFRLWKDQQIVDIWTADGITYKGSVVSYSRSRESYESEKHSKKGPEFFFKQVPVDSLTAKKAFELIQSVNMIPTDRDIKGWREGFDGAEYNLETSTPSDYDFRNYWTPTAQDSSLIPAKKMQTFLNNFDMLLCLHNKFEEFFKSLKPGSYVGDGPMMRMKLTSKQIESLKKTKPYRDYLASVNTRLNNYLSDTLTKILSKNDSLKCYDDFLLQFSKDNKLLKVTTNSKLTDKGDKKEFLICRKKIIEAFALIKVDFVQSKVGYFRELHFYNGKATVYYNGL